MELLIATKNRGKFAEIERALRDLPWIPRFLGDFPGSPRIEEDQTTFEGNALRKAKIISEWSKKPTLSDDSGLVVEALEGRPGIHSARYAGPGATDGDNFRKLLEEMKSVPEGSRRASFICVMVLAIPGDPEVKVEGRCEGEISAQPRGTRGFGYDPVFYLPELKMTMAELPAELKIKISHRGRALQNIKIHLLQK